MKKELSHKRSGLSINSVVLIGATSGGIFGSHWGFYAGIVGMGLGILLMTILKFLDH
ncbi:MAG TPA: hypothetical protein VNB90_06195 [Cytophagaceae bacterium]|jgi:hypothetical protein|nr:hypothetical protein [Cytophagaceae bacterium]